MINTLPEEIQQKIFYYALPTMSQTLYQELQHTLIKRQTYTYKMKSIKRVARAQWKQQQKQKLLHYSELKNIRYGGNGRGSSDGIMAFLR